MACDAARQSGVFAKLSHESSDVLRRRGSAAGVDEKRIRRAPTHFASVSVGDDKLADLGVGNIDAPLPASFSDDRYDAGCQINVVVAKSGEFGNANAGGEE